MVTTFASSATAGADLSGWDRACGFLPGDDVSGARALEDDSALALLGATGQRLLFPELQYRVPRYTRLKRAWLRLRRAPLVEDDPDLVEAVAAALGGVIRASGLGTWLLPLGISHFDHLLTARAALATARDLPAIRWLAYEDLPYARESEANRRRACARIRAAGFRLDALARPSASEDLERKRDAVARYESQLRALGERVEVAIAGPEVYYALTDATVPSRRG